MHEDNAADAAHAAQIKATQYANYRIRHDLVAKIKKRIVKTQRSATQEINMLIEYALEHM